MIQCALDQDGCVDLQTVLRIMNQVGQEEAWGLAYELAALMQRLWPAGNCALIENLGQVCIHRDGFIHEKSLLATSAPAPPQAASNMAPGGPCQAATTNLALAAAAEATTTAAATTTTTTTAATTTTTSQATASTDASKPQQALPPTPPISPELSERQRRRPAPSEAELVSSLGDALFWALDFGIAEDEERKLSPAMEFLICRSQQSLSLNEVLALCTKRLPVPTRAHADLHYREVCRALIGDTLKLSIFLEKIYTATMVLQGAELSASSLLDADCDKLLGAGHHDLHDLNHHHHHHGGHAAGAHFDELSELGLPLASLRVLGISDWARLWMQVIKELRQRGKLK